MPYEMSVITENSSEEVDEGSLGLIETEDETSRISESELTSETTSLDTNTESTSFDSIPEEVNAVPPIDTCMSLPPPPPPPPPPLPPTSNVLPIPSLPINVPDPKQKMKTLSWTRIATSKDQCVWTKIRKMTDSVPVNYTKIEKLFSCKENTTKRASAVKKNILDQQKAMMIDMFLKKKSPDELIEIIRQGLSTELGLSAFRRLKENLPSTKEAESLRDVLPEELENLSKTDYFVSQLISLPNYELWINAMITMGEIDSFDYIPGYVQTISSACDMLMTNESFEKFLRYVLHVGLFMNKGKVAGKAVGFDLCSLQKLSETKSIDDSVTLLEFLVNEIRKSDSSCLKFVCDFHDTLLQTKSCLLQPATDEFNAIKMKVTELQKQIDAETCQIKDQCFKFIQKGKCQIENISEKLETQQVKSQKVADHFAIENINVDEVFKCCRELCENIAKIQKKVCNTNNNFKRGGFRATLPSLRRKSIPTNFVPTAQDFKLQEILAKQKRRCDSVS